jgi:hypothetical protein
MTICFPGVGCAGGRGSGNSGCLSLAQTSSLSWRAELSKGSLESRCLRVRYGVLQWSALAAKYPDDYSI